MAAIQNIKINKAPGITGVTTDMIKNLPIAAINLLTDVIQDFMMSPNCNLASWHIQDLTTLYKGKGDPKDPKVPNNWRGICL